MDKPKICPNCGRQYTGAPHDEPKARVRLHDCPSFGGLYWECQGTKPDGSTCNSTLFIPVKPMPTKESA